MSRKEPDTTNVSRQLMQYRESDGHAVIRGRAASEFIEDHQ